MMAYRAGQRGAWSAERIESESAVGVRIMRDGKKAAVAFRKADVTGNAAVAGLSFDGPVLVEPLR